MKLQRSDASFFETIPVRTFFLILLAGVLILLGFYQFTLHTEKSAITKQNEAFNDTQLIQATVAAQGLELRVQTLQKNLDILSRIAFSEYIDGKRTSADMEYLLASTMEAMQPLVSLHYYTAPKKRKLGTSSKSPLSEQANQLSDKWNAIFWKKVSARQEGFVPPFAANSHHQFFGYMLPVRKGEHVHGILVAVGNFSPLLSAFVHPIRVGHYGTAYLLDSSGQILYDHEAEIIGKNIFEGLHTGFPELERVDKRIVSEIQGKDEYHFPQERGSESVSKLIAWQSLPLGQRTLVLCIAAPQDAASALLADLHNQQQLAWFLLLLALCLIFAAVLHRNTTKQLNTSYTNLSRILENLPDATFVVNSERKIIAWNKALETLSGEKKDAMLGRGMRSYGIPFYGEPHKTLLDYLLDGKPYPPHYRNVQQHGDVTYCELDVSHLRAGKGATLWIQATLLFEEGTNTPKGAIQSIRDITELREAEEKLKASEERFALAVEGSNDGIWDWDLRTDKVYFSPRWLEIVGMESNRGQVLDVEEWTKRIHPDDLHRTMKANHSVFSENADRFEIDYRIRHDDGSYRWVLGRGSCLRDKHGDVYRIAGAHTDITQRVHMQNVTSALFAISNAVALTKDLPELFLEIHKVLRNSIGAKNLIIAKWNEKTDELYFEYSDDEHERNLVPMPNISKEGAKGLNAQVLRQGEPLLLNQEEQLRYEVIGTPSQTWLGVPLRINKKTIGIVSTQDYENPNAFSELDVSLMASISDQIALAIQRKTNEDKLEQLALHDTLTGLPNRRLMDERLSQAIKRQQRSKTNQFAFIAFDIDDFKLINDNYGHAAGDAFLREVGKRISPILRESDTLSRTSGDEFSILLEGFESTQNVIQIVNRVQEAFFHPYQYKDSQIFGGLSIGIVLNPGTSKTPEEIRNAADVAMYSSKNTGKGQFSIYEELRDNGSPIREAIRDNEIQQGLSRNEFEIYLQPIIHTETQQIHSAEALVRWKHPERGILLPGSFLHTLDEHGYGPELGSQVLAKACLACSELLESKMTSPDFSISVNLSKSQLINHKFPQQVQDELDRHGLEPQNIQLEISENILAETSRKQDFLFERLHELGVRLALDNVSYRKLTPRALLRRNFDFIKYSRTISTGAFLSSMEEKNLQIMAGIGDFLHIPAIAQGIETQEQYEMFQKLGCPYMQGFLFGKPQPILEFITFFSALAFSH
ncbi:PAS domain S-box-containing protein/diguanylate cyclase (GGDEF) domain-containing protein [Desulfobaculum bizertense DSM 18034]|uniref:PAS domain S-box-containing protein/diguanylate cyclase (GGDEF) domain-containing protein n=1 Tax=Desulfobaculum bizertense DSM 18034 TaxID=1121442 RepID=A0A1T4WAX8_9BACT|nr:PAS domain S-box-containing protein/diguanylate cyclase (GGDEF) domain-containing protein [Desulfobaculum bizertense DSM 18034]